jgi:hypothetical protein
VFGLARGFANQIGQVAADYITLSNSSTLNPPNAVTFEAWVFLTENITLSWINGTPLFNRDDSYAGIQGYSFAIYTPCDGVTVNALLFYDGGPGGCSTQGLTVGQWHHVAFTLASDGLTKILQLFVDGQLAGSYSYAGGLYTNAFTTFIGRRFGSGGGFPYNSGFVGVIDEVRVSNIVRSPSEFFNVVNP